MNDKWSLYVCSLDLKRRKMRIINYKKFSLIAKRVLFKIAEILWKYLKASQWKQQTIEVLKWASYLTSSVTF